ncbi:hypothetical protein FBU30_000634, partial [Linnemannia zychae]
MTILHQSAYSAIDDDEFDYTDDDIDEEWDDDEWVDAEEEEEVLEKKDVDSEDVPELGDTPWSTNDQPSLQAPSSTDDFLSRPIPESPTAAKAQRLLKKRQLGNVICSTDLNATNNDQCRADLISSASPRPIKQLFRQSSLLNAGPSESLAAQIAATSSSLSVNQSTAMQESILMMEPSPFVIPKTPARLPLERKTPIRSSEVGSSIAKATKKAVFSRTTSSPSITEGIHTRLLSLPEIPLSPRQKVAIRENH